MHEYNNYHCRSSVHGYGGGGGQIPAFGNWDYANELPITQYFECARQAGLLRFSSSSSSTTTTVESSEVHEKLSGDLYAVVDDGGDGGDEQRFRKAGKGRERKVRREKRREQQAKEKQRKPRLQVVCDHPNVGDDVKVKAAPPPQRQRGHAVYSDEADELQRNDGGFGEAPVKRPKAVDEDLYKIPPRLLDTTTTTKRKKVLGFFSRCLVPACTA